MSGSPGWRRWRDAMAEALYGEHGFYRRSGAPGRHFRTAAHVSTAWAAAWSELALRVAPQVDDMAVVEIGAGGGELLAGLAALMPPSWRLVGVDIAPRPPDLPARVEWTEKPPPAFAGVLLAVEWLDVVPVDVVEQTEGGPCYVEVAAGGQERVGAPVGGADLEWLHRWWPLAEPGDRAEIGAPRDAAWAGAVGSLHRGVAVTVDYAADPRRDVAGTLTGYRDGRQVAPRPDGSTDVTSHVLMESCRVAAGVEPSALVAQRTALRALGVDGQRPAYDGDAREYLQQLSAAGEAAELLDAGGLGGFSWLVHAKGVPMPF